LESAKDVSESSTTNDVINQENASSNDASAAISEPLESSSDVIKVNAEPLESACDVIKVKPEPLEGPSDAGDEKEHHNIHRHVITIGTTDADDAADAADDDERFEPDSLEVNTAKTTPPSQQQDASGVKATARCQPHQTFSSSSFTFRQSKLERFSIDRFSNECLTYTEIILYGQTL